MVHHQKCRRISEFFTNVQSVHDTPTNTSQEPKTIAPEPEIIAPEPPTAAGPEHEPQVDKQLSDEQYLRENF